MNLPIVPRARAMSGANVLLVLALAMPPAMAQVIDTIAGNGSITPSGDGGPALEAGLGWTSDVAAFADGSGYLLNGYGLTRKVDGNGLISTLTAVKGSGQRCVDVDVHGNAYICDDYRVVKTTPDGTTTIVAGTGDAGFSGDGGPATQATLNLPGGVAVAADGRVYKADTDNKRVRRVGLDGIITTVAGMGGEGWNGEGIPATEATLDHPKKVALGSDGSLYIADAISDRVRKVGTDGIISTVAGGGIFTDDPVATSIDLWLLEDVAVDGADNIYVLDGARPRIIQVTPEGQAGTVAGGAGHGFSGDGGLATLAAMNWPIAIDARADGQLYVADTENARIRTVSPAPPLPPLLGAGLFRPHDSILLPHDVHRVAVGDVTGDGLADLVMTTRVMTEAGKGRREVWVMQQRPGGTLAPPRVWTYSTSMQAASGALLLVDVDGDGVDNIVVADGAGIVVFGGGPMWWRRVTRTPSGAQPGYASVLKSFDANGDGHADIAAVGAGILLYMGNGTTSFALPQQLTTAQQSYRDMTTGDFDGDGHADLAVIPDDYPQNQIEVLGSNGDGSFRAPVIYGLGDDTLGANALEAGDFNGDGLQDLVVSAGFLRPVLLLRQQGGTLQEPEVIPTYDSVLELQRADVNNDGLDDLVVIGRYWLGVLVQRPGAGTLARKVKYQVPVNVHGNSALALGDIDGDGCADALVSNETSVSRLVSDSCARGVDLAAGLTVAADVVQVRIDNLGDATSTEVLAELTVAVRFGTLQHGNLPSGCMAESVTPRSFQLACLRPPLAPAAGASLSFPYTALGGGERDIITARVELLPDPAETQIGNNISSDLRKVPTAPQASDRDGRAATRAEEVR